MTKHSYHHLTLILIALLFVVLLYEGLTLSANSQGVEKKGFFGVPFSLAKGETQNIEDVVRVTLLDITDSRCLPSTQCTWEGELGVYLNISNSYSKIVQLGEVTNPSVDIFSYTIELNAVTPMSATLTVIGPVP